MSERAGTWGMQVSLHSEAGFCASLPSENPLKTNKSKRHARVKRMVSDSNLDCNGDCDCERDSHAHSQCLPACLPTSLIPTHTNRLLRLRQRASSVLEPEPSGAQPNRAEGSRQVRPLALSFIIHHASSSWHSRRPAFAVFAPLSRFKSQTQTNGNNSTK